MPPMLFCRVSWMGDYRGLRNDSISNPAGRFVKENGWGGECWNYRPCRQRMYGYVKLMGKSTPRAVVRRLSMRQGDDETDADAIEGVTVVWVARNRAANQTCIVGWFTNARVDSEPSRRPDARAIAKDLANSGFTGDGNIHCFITCDRDDSFLLPESQRIFPVRIGEPGWMANNNFVFYPDGGDNKGFEVAHKAFKEEATDYVSLGHETLEHSSTFLPDEVVLDCDEGNLKVLTHVVRERNREVSEKAKRRFRRENEGRLFCEVRSCGFDFAEKYGRLGKKPSYFIEAHHVTPLSEGRRRTASKDFMMLCPNCHRMVHRKMVDLGRTITREETLGIRCK